MRLKHLIGLMATGCALTALLPSVAQAAGDPRATAAWEYKWHRECVRFDLTDPLVCNVLLHGPRGARGLPGLPGPLGGAGTGGTDGVDGRDGATGPVGENGPVGPVGPRGATGAKGVAGGQGIQGPVGANGAYGADGTGGNLELVVGTKIGPIFSASGPMTGTELTPSVARCRVGSRNREAYDGGVKVITTGTGNVVNVESSYPGLYINQTQVDPLPGGAPAGAVSDQAANAYLAQVVIGDLKTNNQVTIQAYVLCGPSS